MKGSTPACGSEFGRSPANWPVPTCAVAIWEHACLSQRRRKGHHRKEGAEPECLGVRGSATVTAPERALMPLGTQPNSRLAGAVRLQPAQIRVAEIQTALRIRISCSSVDRRRGRLAARGECRKRPRGETIRSYRSFSVEVTSWKTQSIWITVTPLRSFGRSATAYVRMSSQIRSCRIFWNP